ncbi:MAG: hypothetical protein ABI480_08765 [Chitinophagaceae bacterium]
MTYIKNNKVLVFVIAVLLLSNIAMLYFYLTDCGDKKKKPDNGGMRAYMIKTLKDSVGFNDQQIATYQQISDKHKAAMKPLFEEITNAKDSLYKLLLVDKPSDSLINHYLLMIGERQRNIDQRIFNHFSSLKEICTDDQRPKYDSLIQHVIKGMIGFPKKKDNKDQRK